MLVRGDVFENPRTGARLEILETPREGSVLRVERVYKPHTGKADPHVHLDFEQTFEVVDGRMSATLDGEERELGPGESVHIPREVAHVDAWNDTGDDLRVRARFEPVPEFVEGYTEALGHLMREGKLNDQGEFNQLQLFVILREFEAQSFAANIPRPVQKVGIPLMAGIGRMRGYRARHGDGVQT